MQVEQEVLFDEKKYLGVLPPVVSVDPPTPDSTALQTLPAYELYLRSGGYSKYTPGDFTGDMRRFGTYMKERKRFGFQMTEKVVKDITVGDIRSWIGELRKIMTAKTVSRKVTTLNNYFLWLVNEGVINENPMEGIAQKRVTSPLPDILFENEQKELLAMASSDPRSYLIFLFFLKTAITLEELLAIKEGDIDFSNEHVPELWVQHKETKQHRNRKLPLPPETKAAFDKYVAQYTYAETLFSCSDRWIRAVITEVTKKTGIKKRVSPQILRDSCAVQWMKEGRTIETVLNTMGYSEMTREDARIKLQRLTKKVLLQA